MKAWLDTLQTLSGSKLFVTRFHAAAAGGAINVPAGDVSLSVDDCEVRHYDLEFTARIWNLPCCVRVALDVSAPWFVDKGIGPEDLQHWAVRQAITNRASELCGETVSDIRAGRMSTAVEFPLLVSIKNKTLPINLGFPVESVAHQFISTLADHVVRPEVTPMDSLMVRLDLVAASLPISLQTLENLEVGDWIAVD